MPKNNKSYAINDEALAELHHLGLRIIEQFPPDQYFYVGVGRSPTPIIAWLQMHFGQTAATQLPLSNFHLCAEDYKGDIKKAPMLPLNNDCAARLFRHFDPYLRHELGSGRRWLVIDTVMSGNTLKSAAYALTEYLYAHDHFTSTPVEMLGIVQSFGEPEKEAKPYKKLGMHVAMVSAFENEDENEVPCTTSLESHLIHGDCLAMSPVGMFDWVTFKRHPNYGPEPVNQIAYSYLLARIYFFVVLPSLSTWWLSKN